MMENFKCYSAKLANALCKEGFKMIGTEINYKKPQFNVFLFEDSEELRTVFNNYCERKA